MQTYFDPKRARDPHALPDQEVFYSDGTNNPEPRGWYWWACFPGCLPDGEPTGPFVTEAEAILDARSGLE